MSDLGHNFLVEGYILRYRSVADHPVVGHGLPVKPHKPGRRTKSRGEAWEDLLFRARFRSGTAKALGMEFKLERGELLAGTGLLSETWNWSEGCVKGFLRDLSLHDMIRLCDGATRLLTPHRGTPPKVITICNYCEFQTLSEVPNTPSEHPSSSNTPPNTPLQHPSEHPSTQEKINKINSINDKEPNLEHPTEHPLGTPLLTPRRKKDSFRKKDSNPYSPQAALGDVSDLNDEAFQVGKATEQPDQIDEQFDLFWSTYPAARRERKVDSQRAFREIVAGKHKRVPRTCADAIIAGAKALSAKVAAGFDARYVPQAASYLNGARWLDDSAASPASSPSGDDGDILKTISGAWGAKARITAADRQSIKVACPTLTAAEWNDAIREVEKRWHEKKFAEVDVIADLHATAKRISAPLPITVEVAETKEQAEERLWGPKLSAWAANREWNPHLDGLPPNKSSCKAPKWLIDKYLNTENSNASN